jgi:hypothetical protein
MADFPCDFHAARYDGASTRMYLNLYRDDRVIAFRASVCVPCLLDALIPWLDRALHKGPDGRWIIPDIRGGSLELDDLWIARSGASGPS